MGAEHRQLLELDLSWERLPSPHGARCTVWTEPPLRTPPHGLATLPCSTSPSASLQKGLLIKSFFSTFSTSTPCPLLPSPWAMGQSALLGLAHLELFCGQSGILRSWHLFLFGLLLLVLQSENENFLVTRFGWSSLITPRPVCSALSSSPLDSN